MTSPKPAFSIVDGEQLPFKPRPTDSYAVEDTFRCEISLLAARFKTQITAAMASDSSPRATAFVVSAADDGAAAASAPAHSHKNVDTRIFALPDCNKCTFEGPVRGKAAAAAITVSSDPAAEDEVTWEAGSCVTTFDTKLKVVVPDDKPRKWQQEILDISLIQHKATNEYPPRYPGFIKDKTTKLKGVFIPLSRALINLADFVSTPEPRVFTYTSHPGEWHPPMAFKYSLTLQVKTTPLKRLPAVRVPKSPEQIAMAAKSNLGNARCAQQLLFKVDRNCNFKIGSSIGIFVEEAWKEAWKETSIMLLHTRSSFVECVPDALNFFGRVVGLSVESDHIDLLVKCPEAEVAKSENGKTCPESRFGWRLLSTCSRTLKESIDMRSPPYPSFDMQKEPVFCIFLRGGAAAKEDDVVAERNENSAKTSARADARLSAVFEVTLKKKEVEQIAAKPARISFDQLGMMRLRQCFLIVQPLISDVVKRLFAKWFSDPSRDPESYKGACARAFKSSEGPWDVFTIIKGLLFKMPGTFEKLAKSFGVSEPEKDHEKRALESTLLEIYAVRNCWAHVQVTMHDCLQALHAIKTFVRFFPPEFSSNSETVLRDIDSIISSSDVRPRHHNPSISIDDMAYFYFGCASLHLSHVSRILMKNCQPLPFCAYLQRMIEIKHAKFRKKRITVPQSDIVEVGDVTAALKALIDDALFSDTNIFDLNSFIFDCKTIRTVRNHFAHAPEIGNSIIIVLIALGSLARMISVVLNTCICQARGYESVAAAVQTIQADAERFCSEINTWQAVLLEKAGMLDANVLVSAICNFHQDVLGRNPYRTFARDSYQKLRLLVTGDILGEAPDPSFSSKLEGTNRSRERSILNFVARVPPARSESAESAVEWLVEQARDQNVCMQSVVHFFKKETRFKGVDGNVLDSACSDDAGVSMQGKKDLTE
jgi:hypothetical protein